MYRTVSFNFKHLNQVFKIIDIYVKALRPVK